MSAQRILCHLLPPPSLTTKSQKPLQKMLAKKLQNSCHPETVTVLARRGLPESFADQLKPKHKLQSDASTVDTVVSLTFASVMEKLSTLCAQQVEASSPK